MKILTFTLLVGCLAAVSVGTRPKQNAYAEEDATFSDREQEQEEVVISDINRNRAVQLVTAIRAQHRSTRGHYTVMCLVPITPKTSSELTFNDLLYVAIIVQVLFGPHQNRITLNPKPYISGTI